MARILITGGAGYIGVNLTHYLVKRGLDEIVVLDNESSGRLALLSGLPVWCIKGDIQDGDILKFTDNIGNLPNGYFYPLRAIKNILKFLSAFCLLK